MAKVTKRTVVSKRFQGGQYIVVSYDNGSGNWTESSPMDYYKACATVKRLREAWDTRNQCYNYAE